VASLVKSIKAWQRYCCKIIMYRWAQACMNKQWKTQCLQLLLTPESRGINSVLSSGNCSENIIYCTHYTASIFSSSCNDKADCHTNKWCITKLWYDCRGTWQFTIGKWTTIMPIPCCSHVLPIIMTYILSFKTACQSPGLWISCEAQVLQLIHQLQMATRVDGTAS